MLNGRVGKDGFTCVSDNGSLWLITALLEGRTLGW